MNYFRTAFLLGTLGMFCLACSTFMQPGKSQLEWSQSRYVQIIRWNTLEKADQFVAQEDRDALRQVLQRISLLRISDYETGPVEMAPDGKFATFVVSYTGYDRRSLIEHRLIEYQDWYLHPERKVWLFRPHLENIQDISSESDRPGGL